MAERWLCSAATMGRPEMSMAPSSAADRMRSSGPTRTGSRIDEPGARRLGDRRERIVVHRMGDGRFHRRQVSSLVDDGPEFGAAVMQQHFGQHRARPAYLFGWRQNRCRPVDHGLAVLIGAQAIEDDALFFVVLAGCRDADRDRVADADRTSEFQGLADIDSSGAGKVGAEHGGDQGAAPHAVSDDLVKHLVVGVFLVEMGRIDVTGHDGE